MNSGNALSRINAARFVASAFGILSGLGSFTHGVGEVLQGSVAPDGIVINSWTHGPIADHLGGEPGMTIVPNLLVTGWLTMIVALALIIWSAAFVGRKRGGPILMLLAVTMLLVGGGFAPPVIGLLSGVAALGISASYAWWQARLQSEPRHLLARVWPWVFGVTLANGIFLVVGSVILVVFFGLDAPQLFVDSFLVSIPLVLLTILTGVAYDLENKARAQGQG